MTAITYDMQKLDEAVSALAGPGALLERLQDTIIPLGTLHMAGLKNENRAAEFESIYVRLTDETLRRSTADELAKLSYDIVALQTGNWYDTVWALEDGQS